MRENAAKGKRGNDLQKCLKKAFSRALLQVAKIMKSSLNSFALQRISHSTVLPAVPSHLSSLHCFCKTAISMPTLFSVHIQYNFAVEASICRPHCILPTLKETALVCRNANSAHRCSPFKPTCSCLKMEMHTAWPNHRHDGAA